MVLIKAILLSQILTLFLTFIIHIKYATLSMGTYIPYWEVYDDRVWVVISCFTLAFFLGWFSRKDKDAKTLLIGIAAVLVFIGGFLSMHWRFRGRAYLRGLHEEGQPLQTVRESR